MSFIEFIDTRNNYNIYNCNYKYIVANIEIDIEFGKTLKKAPNPNVLLNKFITDENAIPIFTDGSKIKDALFRHILRQSKSQIINRNSVFVPEWINFEIFHNK